MRAEEEKGVVVVIHRNWKWLNLLGTGRRTEITQGF